MIAFLLFIKYGIYDCKVTLTDCGLRSSINIKILRVNALSIKQKIEEKQYQILFGDRTIDNNEGADNISKNKLNNKQNQRV